MENTISKIPFMFEMNKGQYKNEAKFALRNSKSTVFFLDSKIAFVFMKSKEDEIKDKSIEDKLMQNKDKEIKPYEFNLFRMILENSNKNPEILGLDEFDCKLNYFKGTDDSEWITDVEIYEKLIYKEVYPGIDVVFYENQGILEHDFIVSPNADINNIKITFEGVDNIEIDADGNIVIYVKENTVKMLKPKVYQEIENTKVEIESSFIIDNDCITFNVSTYDKSKVLVIDPGILYGSYLGGPDDDNGYGVAVDANQYAYITGDTYSATGFPILNQYQGTLNGSTDAFLIKIDTKASGSASLLYGSYLGGDSDDTGRGVAVDANQIAYIVGRTFSANGFPLLNAYQGALNGSSDAFLIKIDTKVAGVPGLLYGTYLGGDGDEHGYDVVVDGNQIAYLTGDTTSANGFPLLNAYQGALNGVADAFLIKIDTKVAGVPGLLYGTYLGGVNREFGTGVAIDTNQIAYITGSTNSLAGLPLLNPYQGALSGFLNAFLIKIDTKVAGVPGLLYGTYLGGTNLAGSSITGGQGVAVDTTGKVYITGYTDSTAGFPLKNAYQGAIGGADDAFLIKIDTTVGGVPGLLYGTYLGGSNTDIGNRVVIDANGNAYLTGYTNSATGFPILNPYQGTFGGVYDAYLIKIDTNLSGTQSLKYGTYLGGNNDDSGYGVGIDTDENAYIAGSTNSTAQFPLKNEYQGTLGGAYDAFLIKINTLEADISVVKNSDKDFVTIGDTVTYTMTILNQGPADAVNVTLTDSIPVEIQSPEYSTNGVNYSPWLGSVNLGIMPVSISETIYIKGTIANNVMGTISNTATVSSSTFDPNPGNNSSTKDINVNVATISSRKVSNKLFADIGTTITYTVELQNTGNVAATNVLFSDTIPNDTIFVYNSLSINGTTIPGNPTPPGVNIGSIPAGSVSTVSFDVIVNTIPSPNPILNNSTATYTYTVDPSIPTVRTGSNNTNTAYTQVNSARIISKKTVDKNYAKCGDSIKYTIMLINTGNVTATNVVFIDTVPNGTNFIANSVTVNGATIPLADPNVGVNIATIGAGTTSTITFDVSIVC